LTLHIAFSEDNFNNNFNTHLLFLLLLYDLILAIHINDQTSLTSLKMLCIAVQIVPDAVNAVVCAPDDG
jgi:hypothetical protein